MLIRNARLVALTGDVPGPVDVRLGSGRVTELGTGLRPDGAPVLDAAGRWLMPGLWDQHVHLGQWSVSSCALGLTGPRSAEEALALDRQRLAVHSDRPAILWAH